MFPPFGGLGFDGANQNLGLYGALSVFGSLALTRWLALNARPGLSRSSFARCRSSWRRTSRRPSSSRRPPSPRSVRAPSLRTKFTGRPEAVPP